MIEFIFGIILGFLLGIFFMLLAIIRDWIASIEEGEEK